MLFYVFRFTNIKYREINKCTSVGEGRLLKCFSWFVNVVDIHDVYLVYWSHQVSICC